MLTLNELLTKQDISSCTAYYLSDKQSEKEVASYESMQSKLYYLNKFIEDLMSIFVWENLPNDIPSYIVEYLLMSVGRVLMYDDNGELVISRYAMTSFNDYYEPVTVQTISIATVPREIKTLYDDEFEYCWCNNSGYPPFNMAYELADKLWHIDKTITYIHKQMRRPTIFKGHETMKKTLNNIMNENDPKTWYVVSKDMQELLGVPVTNIDVGKGLDILMRMRNMYLQEWNSRVGLHAVQSDKKERLTEFEGEGFGELGNINIAGMYQQRLRFASLINKHWNCNVKVRYNDVIKTRGEDIHYEDD